MDSPVPVKVIAIVGGGASGSLVAAQLLHRARGPLRIVLYERMSDVGRGVAYGTRFPEHRLNVPAGKMSAFPDRPAHFLEWIQAVLQEARAQSAPGVEFEVVKGEVIDLEENDEGGARLRCGGGLFESAHKVVLAIGNLPGEYPIRRTLPIYHSQRYVHVPWQPGAMEGIPADAEVLLVGAGLTAIDIILELHGRGHTGAIHALSRRGLLPKEHAPSPPYADFLANETLPSTTRALMRRVRREVKAAKAQGVDWRPVLDALRPRSQDIWGALSWEERGRFMRHVRPFWDVHRHRIAPPVAARLEAMRQSGQLRFYAGRLTELTEKTDGVEARFRLRGTPQVRALRVAKVLNCTGPRTDYSKYQHPLLLHLLSNGLIDHDPLALGIVATPRGEVVNHRGDVVTWLYTLGAPLKGDLWECTAMPEIRVQAESLAKLLLS